MGITETFQMKSMASVAVAEDGTLAANERAARRALRDKKEMMEFGKLQQLKRRFGLMSMISFACILTCTWEALFSTFLAGFANGGPAGLVVGFIYSWAGTLCLAASIGEMASMMPLSGGQYFWVYYIAPPKYRVFLSYLTGWINVLGWQAGTASLAFPAGTQVQGLLVLNYPGYEFQRWHGTLLLYAVITVSLIVNTYLAKHLPKLEGIMFILHMLCFFGILIPLVYLSPHGTAKDVFSTWFNEGGWDTQTLAFFVGMVTSVYSFLGVDSCCHMAEEIQGASTIVPWSMLFAIVVNGALGFAMLIAILFCLGDVEAILATPTGFPFIEIFRQATGTVSGATAMTAFIITLMVFATTACFTTASRMMWAFARDNGLPFSSHLKRVDKGTSLPLYSIGTTFMIVALLALINIGSTVAFNACISLVVAGFFVSYIFSISLMLNRRLRPEVEKSQLRWGPWRMGKWTGAFVNVFALKFCIISTIFSFFPPTKEVTPETMNWSALVFGAVVIFSLVYYAIYGNNTFQGPVIETEGEDSGSE